ncbi:MAG: AarF/ABC1/UbiB kinase family protein [Polyangiaceae bacterium]|nr:AarF/ABC1/UbiB kinase family protein [Polyangiaceae bacterium]
MGKDRKVPQGRLARLALLASVGARTGVGILTKDSQGAAERATEVLGRMRGLAAKVGQIASYVDGLIPEGGSEPFQRALASLRESAMTSTYGEVRSIVEEELGGPIDRLYASFEEMPFASASIGQVHRATLHDGREVAVKVQHPGIAKAVDSDLKSAALLEPLASFAAGRKVDSKLVLEEMALRLREELDYALEAERQEHFRKVHWNDPKIRIPAVVGDRSKSRVLTTELASGVTLDDLATRPEADRRASAETLWRFVFKGNLVGRMFNADPHPGNYLFGEDGVVTFLDFGCVEPIVGDRWEHALGLHKAALRRDEDAFAGFAKKLLHTRGGQWEAMAIGFSRSCFEPIFASPFKVTRTFAAGLVGKMKEMGKNVRKLPPGEYVPVPRGMVFMNRLQFGFYSVLARLDVEADYAEVERRFLREADLL